MLTISKASAGAGKTFLLTQTYIDMLFAAHQTRNAHRRILAVTFTKKATAEMKQRIVRELSILSHGKESAFTSSLQQKYNLTTESLQQQAQQILYDLLQDYSAFAVSTIDSFFQQVIRSFSRELGLSGKYNLELDTHAIQQNAIDNLFLSLSPKEDKQTFNALLNIIDENLDHDQPWDPKQSLLTLSEQLFSERLLEHKTDVFACLEDADAIQLYRSKLTSIRTQYIADYKRLAQAIANYLQDNHLPHETFSNGKKMFAPLQADDAQIIKYTSEQPAYLCKFANGNSILRKAQQKDTTLCMHEAALRTLIIPLIEHLTGKRSVELQTATTILKTFDYILLLSKVAQYIEIKNKELHRLPISETNDLLHQVIAANETSPFIYEKIGTRIRNFLIDEFQDTSNMQWDNFRPLIQESLSIGERNLVVGDVKQSIYRFRNSNYDLMLRGIERNFPQAQVDTMKGNWRSNPNIVLFNNHLFGQLASLLNTEMNTFMGEHDNTLLNIMEKVYADHEQEPMLAQRDNHAKGYVQVQFSSGKTTTEWRESVLKQLPNTLADIQQRGIPLGRVACLIRNNKDALPIAETLIAAGYKVMSNEGLKLHASPLVMFIIVNLQRLLYPTDAVLRTQHDYLLQLLQLSNVSPEPHFDTQGSLLEIVQTIIQHYRLNTITTEQPYLLALQDAIYAYCTKYASDLYTFLSWWEEHADSLSLSMPETDDAIQLVSIHKSKGLEYDVVLIPFCDWDKSLRQSGGKVNILWATPPTKWAIVGDKSLPILPVYFTKELANTEFAADYYHELLNLYLDNLNMTYVAFTRAKKELYIFAPALPNTATESKHMGGQLQLALQHDAGKMALVEEGDIITYTMGEKATYQQSQANKCTTSTPIQETEQDPTTSSQLALRLPSRDFFPSEDNPQMMGKLLHQILQSIQAQGDEEQIIQQYIQTGMLQTVQVPSIKQAIQQFWQLLADANKQDWFAPNQYTVLTERDILLPDGNIRRPDRVLIDNTAHHAIVLDYKFGHIEKDAYTAQVCEYMHLLQDMGYTTEGYLVYVALNKIQPV